MIKELIKIRAKNQLNKLLTTVKRISKLWWLMIIAPQPHKKACPKRACPYNTAPFRIFAAKVQPSTRTDSRFYGNSDRKGKVTLLQQPQTLVDLDICFKSKIAANMSLLNQKT